MRKQFTDSSRNSETFFQYFQGPTEMCFGIAKYFVTLSDALKVLTDPNNCSLKITRTEVKLK